MTHCTFISYLWVIHKCLCNLFRFRMTSDMPQKEQKRGAGGSYLKWCPLLPSLSQQQSWSRAGRTVRECRHAYAADKEIVVTAGEAAGGWWLLDDWCKSGVFVCVCMLETPGTEAMGCGSKKVFLFLDYNSCNKTVCLSEKIQNALPAAAPLSFHLIRWLICF